MRLANSRVRGLFLPLHNGSCFTNPLKKEEKMAKTVTRDVNGNNADMYTQRRGAGGRFGSGSVQAGSVNRLYYYDSGEQRNVQTQSGRRISARTAQNLTNQAGARAERRFNY